MLPSGRWALTPPFHPCQMRSTETGELPVFPKACRRGASITGGLIFCGTFRSRARRSEPSPVAVTQPPGVTRRVALLWPALASSPRPESGLSSRPLPLARSEPAITRLTRLPIIRRARKPHNQSFDHSRFFCEIGHLLGSSAECIYFGRAASVPRTATSHAWRLSRFSQSIQPSSRQVELQHRVQTLRESK